MELRTLKYFVTVAEELNITHAAEKLNMSQPPLTNQIKSLEDELNTTLFVRGRRQLKLTESGELLYRRAKEIISLSEKAGEEIISMSSGMAGIISLGLVEGIAPGIVSKWIADFMKKYPKVRFRILDGNSDDLTEKLRSGLISLAVITSPCDQLLLNSFSVGTEPMIALINKNHQLSKVDGDSINIRDLIGEPLIVPGRKTDVENIYRWFRNVNAKPNIICETDSYLDAAALTGMNVGISILPGSSSIHDKSVISKKLSGKDKYTEYLFVWRKGRPLPIVEETFIDYIKEQELLS